MGQKTVFGSVCNAKDRISPSTYRKWIKPCSLSELKGADSHIPDESHWLADWNRQEPRYKVGEIVRFKVTKVSDLNNWGHVSNARNINFIN